MRSGTISLAVKPTRSTPALAGDVVYVLWKYPNTLDAQVILVTHLPNVVTVVMTSGREDTLG